MVYLDDVLDTTMVQEHIDAGLISDRRHRDFPFGILNYTPECQWQREWNNVTMPSRGLIYHTDTMEVLARPFPKFFNWDESGSIYPPGGACIRMEKMDGSLGILYQTPDGPAIATRGSFHSEQAEWATSFMKSNTMEFKDGLTYLFEIIYRDNRIVVDYGDYAGLVLLDVIDNGTGLPDLSEFNEHPWPDKVTRRYMTGFDSGQVAEIPPGDEGFVFLWPHSGFRTKMKSAEYVEIHRLVSNLSEKWVWEALLDGKPVNDILRGLPEEFHPFVEETAQGILTEVVRIVVRVTRKYDEYTVDNSGKDRKHFATHFKDDPDKKYLFMMLDNKPIYEVVLRASKPTRQTDFAHEG